MTPKDFARLLRATIQDVSDQYDEDRDYGPSFVVAPENDIAAWHAILEAAHGGHRLPGDDGCEICDALDALVKP